MSLFTDIEVECGGHEALAQTVQQMGAFVVLPETWNGRTVKVRCFGDAGYLKFAINRQGYGRVVENEPDFSAS
jgi:hypothetical protein